MKIQLDGETLEVKAGVNAGRGTKGQISLSCYDYCGKLYACCTVAIPGTVPENCVVVSSEDAVIEAALVQSRVIETDPVDVRICGYAVVHVCKLTQRAIDILMLGKPTAACYVCGYRFAVDAERLREWAESGRPYDPTDWKCMDCFAAEDAAMNSMYEQGLVSERAMYDYYGID